MKAAIRKAYGPPETVRILEIPMPEAKPDEIRIKVKACTVNRTDIGVFTGKPYIMRFFVGLPQPSSPRLGTDFAGVVDQVGSQVKDYQAGDRVWGFVDSGCGSHAEYFCLNPKTNVLKLHEDISFLQAAGSIEAAHYAINFINKVPLRTAAEALVIGGTGAIGSACIQLLKNEGIRVTAVSLGQADKVYHLGADRVIDAQMEDFTQSTRSYDFILDAVGKSRFSICKPLLRPKGIYLSSELGPNWENPFLAITTSLSSGKKVKFPIPLDIKKSLKLMENLLLTNKFKPLIDRICKLGDLQEIYPLVASGQKSGNVILSLDL